MAPKHPLSSPLAVDMPYPNVADRLDVRQTAAEDTTCVSSELPQVLSFSQRIAQVVLRSTVQWYSTTTQLKMNFAHKAEFVICD